MPEANDDTDPLLSHAPVQRLEWMIAIALILSGTILRCWQPSRMAVEHFDEGVYSSNVFFPDTGDGYPFRHLYAPPLLPALLEFAFIFGDGSAHSVMWVNLLAGCLMIPSIWWVGRQWFGPATGLAAATLAAFSEAHILYSRTALTDGLLCLWMLWGVYWAWRAILTGRPAAILLAGVFASLAWWTKYNGWLTLAISGAGTAAWLFVEWLVGRGRSTGPAQESKGRRGLPTILRWTAISAITVVGWLPYLIELQSHGGYAAVAANHARYFVGTGGWGAGFLRQWANLRSIEAYSGVCAMLALMALPIMFGTERGDGERVSRRAFAGFQAWLIWLGVMGFVFVVGTSLPLFLLTGVGLAALLRPAAGRTDSRQRLAAWMIAAWVIGLTVAIPLYHPYPRLTLPWVVATWLGGGLGFRWLLPRLCDNEFTRTAIVPTSKFSSAALAGIGFIACGLLLMLGASRNDVAWEDRRGLQSISAGIREALPKSGLQVVYVVGQPGLFFHLAVNDPLRSDRAVLPAVDLALIAPADFAARGVSVFAVVGPTSTDNGSGINWAEANLQLIDQWPYAPSTLVLLNEHSPQTIKTVDLEPVMIRLYRIGE